MSPWSVRKHASGGVAGDQPSVAEPSFAERARTLMCLGRIGSLSTLSRKQPGRGAPVLIQAVRHH